ncbi:MAG: transglutaminase domain-containing protein [Syntrophaceae bacterium]|nr:transglutaminase domain-containing protein [Syntrophaceae bacterium]
MIEARRARDKRFLGRVGAWAAAGILAAGAMCPALSATRVLVGKHAIVYDIVNPTGVEFLPNYSNNSYTQKVLQEDEFSKRVLIEVNLAPLNSTAPFPVSAQQMPHQMRAFLGPEKNIPVNESNILSQAKALTQGSRTVHEAVTAVFNWIVDNFTYDAGRNTPQDGRSVFYSKRGSCVGYTQLAIAMLRSLGIPARYAHGYLPPGYDWGISKKYWGVQISGGGYHAWVEVFYMDIGWCFSDLLHSKNFVDPFHVLRYTDGINLNPRNIRGGSLDVEDATTFTIFREENATLAIDQLPLPKKDFLARQSLPQQFGTIYGKVKDPSGKIIPKGSLVLWAGIQGRTIPFENGIYSLLGLEDGEYRVIVRADGHGETEKHLTAKKGEVKQVDLVLSPRESRPSSPPPKPKTTPKAKP